VTVYPAEVGRVAISAAGRDQGRMFVILRILDAQYVYIADGDLRKIGSPKKKKLKHLKLCPQTLDAIAEKLEADVKVFDAEIRSAIRACKQESDAEKGETSCQKAT